VVPGTNPILELLGRLPAVRWRGWVGIFNLGSTSVTQAILSAPLVRLFYRSGRMPGMRPEVVLLFLRELDLRGGAVIDGDDWLESGSAVSQVAIDELLIDGGSGWSVHYRLLKRGDEMLALNSGWSPGKCVLWPPSR
jgi:hypothetical protein